MERNLPGKGNIIMPEIHYLLLIALLIVASVLWLQQLQTRNAGWVDVFWSWSVGVVGLIFLVMVPAKQAGFSHSDKAQRLYITAVT